MDSRIKNFNEKCKFFFPFLFLPTMDSLKKEKKKKKKKKLMYSKQKPPHKTLRVHSARYTQCIHVSSRKLKIPKDTRTKKYKQPLTTRPFPKVHLYMWASALCIRFYSNPTPVNRSTQFHLLPVTVTLQLF